MLALQFIRDSPDRVRQAAADRGVTDAPIDRILELDEQRRISIQEVENRQAEQNALNKTVAPAIAEARAAGMPIGEIPLMRDLERLKAEIRGFQEQRGAVERELNQP